MSSVRYYNDFEKGEEISLQIDSGMTKLFEDRREAQKYADSKRTYVFDVYKSEKYGIRKWHAFGVVK